MTRPTTRPLSVLTALLLATGLARADRIYLTDGTTIDDADISKESLTEISYKASGKSRAQTLDPDKVLKIEYSKLPRLIDQGLGFAMEGDLASAVIDLDNFAEGVISGSNRKDRQPWAPGFALRRSAEFKMTMGDLKGVIGTADRIIESLPDSRHVPWAFLTKAEAQRYSGNAKGAQDTIAAFRAVVETKSLSNYWKLEADLAEVQADPNLRGQAKLDRLFEIQAQAGNDYPVVKNRARVLEGEHYLEGDRKDFDKASKTFERVVNDPKADDSTLAGAYTGLGDCQFQIGVNKVGSGQDATDDLKQALMNYLRVVVVYENQSRYVPKAMFFAGRVFDLIGSEDSKANARKMYTAVLRTYPSSNWANEAKSYR